MNMKYPRLSQKNKKQTGTKEMVKITPAATLTCLILKLDTDMIMVGLLQISSGRTQREKMAFCLGDSASFPALSLVG